MILRNRTLEELFLEIREKHTTIAVYGAGMIGQVIRPYFLNQYGVGDLVKAYYDMDAEKQRTAIRVGKRFIPVFSGEKVKELSTKTVLLITVSHYLPVIEWLDSFPELKGVEGYILPVLLAERAKNLKKCSVQRRSEVPLIPRKINYCWLSRREKPDSVKHCIDSWHRFCPDYEVKEWNEDNFDFFSNDYMREAYEAGKYGFVPDVARLEILYQYGGIYLDTDVELIRNLDDLLFQPSFTGVEKWGSVNFGGCSGAAAGNAMVRRLLDFRINEHFRRQDGSLNMTTCGYYETSPLFEMGFRPDNTYQTIEELTIYPSDYFHPYDYMSGETCLTENTYSIHHFTSSWLGDKAKTERDRCQQQYKKILERMR